MTTCRRCGRLVDTAEATPTRPCKGILDHDIPGGPAMTEETQALERYGVTWTGEKGTPLHAPMPDGYWTPWHLAAAALTTLARDLETAQYVIDRQREHMAQTEDHHAAAVRAARAETWAEASVAEQVARLAHRGQADKAGRPYIEHVERVVARVKGDPRAEEVAWLHDVIEDTMFSENMLALFVDDPDTLGAVCTLTRDKEFESYAQYIENVCTSGDPVALKVKLADLRDHLDNPGCPESLRPRYVAALAQVERATTAREGQ